MRSIFFEKNIPKVLLAKALQLIWPGVIYSGLSPVQYVEQPFQPLPRADFVRVRNLLSGICASDLHILFLNIDPSASPGALPGTDRIYLGHEVFGEVTEVGAEVTAFRVGDRVVLDRTEAHCAVRGLEPPCRHCQEGNPGLCENISLEGGIHGIGGGWGDEFVVHETNVYPVPNELDNDTAMLIEPLSVGVRTVLRRQPKSSDKVLVIGAGMIGLATAWAARQLAPDCHLTVFARYPQQVALAQKLGADKVLTPTDPYAATVEITGAKLYEAPFNNRMLIGGFDVIYDSIGTQKTVHDSLRITRAGGTVVLAGVHLGPMKLDLTPIWYQEVDLVGLIAHGMEQLDGKPISTYELTTQLLLDGDFPAHDFITHRFPLEDWQAAVQTAADKGRGAIKVIFEF